MTPRELEHVIGSLNMSQQEKAKLWDQVTNTTDPDILEHVLATSPLPNAYKMKIWNFRAGTEPQHPVAEREQIAPEDTSFGGGFMDRMKGIAMSPINQIQDLGADAGKAIAQGIDNNDSRYAQPSLVPPIFKPTVDTAKHLANRGMHYGALARSDAQTGDYVGAGLRGLQTLGAINPITSGSIDAGEELIGQGKASGGGKLAADAVLALAPEVAPRALGALRSGAEAVRGGFREMPPMGLRDNVQVAAMGQIPLAGKFAAGATYAAKTGANFMEGMRRNKFANQAAEAGAATRQATAPQTLPGAGEGVESAANSLKMQQAARQASGSQPQFQAQPANLPRTMQSLEGAQRTAGMKPFAQQIGPQRPGAPLPPPPAQIPQDVGLPNVELQPPTGPVAPPQGSPPPPQMRPAPVPQQVGSSTPYAPKPVPQMPAPPPGPAAPPTASSTMPMAPQGPAAVSPPAGGDPLSGAQPKPRIEVPRGRSSWLDRDWGREHLSELPEGWRPDLHPRVAPPPPRPMWQGPMPEGQGHVQALPHSTTEIPFGPRQPPARLDVPGMPSVRPPGELVEGGPFPHTVVDIPASNSRINFQNEALQRMLKGEVEPMAGEEALPSRLKKGGTKPPSKKATPKTKPKKASAEGESEDKD